MKKWFADRYEELSGICMLQNSKNVPCAMWEKAGLDLCTVMVTFRDGVAYESKEEWGFSQVLKQFHGSRMDSNGNMAQKVMTFSTKDSVSYVILVPSSEIRSGFNLLKNSLNDRIIESTEIEFHSNALREALSKEVNNPWRNNQVVLESILLSPHPISRRQLDLTNFDVEEIGRNLLPYKGKGYCLENMVLTLVGSFNLSQLSHEVELFLSLFPKGVKRTINGTFGGGKYGSHRGKTLLLDYPNARQTSLSIGWQIPKMDERTHIAWQLLNTIIGSGLSSDLFQKVTTEYGLTGVAQSKLRTYPSVGTWRMQMNTFNENLTLSLEQLKNQLLHASLRGISSERLSHIKKVCWGSMLIDFDDQLYAAQWLNQHLRLFGDVCYLADYGQHLASVMEEELLSLIEIDLAWENRTTCLSGNMGSIQSHLSQVETICYDEKEIYPCYKSS